MGNQLAGGVAYFSILTLFPVLMSAFSLLGLTLTVIRPDWLVRLKNVAVQDVGTAVGGEKAISLMDRALADWKTIGVIGVVSAIYAGSGWMNGLRGAIRAQWRPDFDWKPQGRHWAIERLVSLLFFMLLLFSVALSFGVTTLGSQLADAMVRWLDLQGRPGVALTLKLGAFALTTLTGWLMFLFLYRVLPQYQAPTRYLITGSLGAAIALSLMQFLTTYLIARFSRTFSAVVFGNIIIVMLYFNLYARLTLFAAAWIATGYQPALPRQYSETDLPLRGRPGVVTVNDHWAFADADREQRERDKAAAEAQEQLEIAAKRARPARWRGRDDQADEAAKRHEAEVAGETSHASEPRGRHRRPLRLGRHRGNDEPPKGDDA